MSQQQAWIKQESGLRLGFIIPFQNEAPPKLIMVPSIFFKSKVFFAYKRKTEHILNLHYNSSSTSITSISSDPNSLQCRRWAWSSSYPGYSTSIVRLPLPATEGVGGREHGPFFTVALNSLGV